ncbi:uncharacterized protein [Anabrus simplex]|uniref:uncharacterized protein isoform X4 n=1 Tax=Anabrus simplex TaxID=316456 RepID=UPI0035A2E4C2
MFLRFLRRQNFHLELVVMLFRSRGGLLQYLSGSGITFLTGILSNNMEEPVFVKCEPTWSSETEEPSNTGNIEFVSEVKPLEQEIKSELTVPGPTQQNIFEPSAHCKEEVFIEHQPFPNIIEENKYRLFFYWPNYIKETFY